MPEPVLFQNLCIDLQGERRGRFKATLRAPATGVTATETFRPPFALKDLPSFLDHLELSIRGLTRDLRAPASGPAFSFSSRDIGSRLFDSLLHGKVLRHFDPVRAAVDDVPDGGGAQGLRLRLRVDLEDKSVRPLAALPWELLHDSMTRDFYSMGRRHLLVRDLASPTAFQPPKVEPSLRVLALSASPHGTQPLDLAREMRELVAALHRPGLLEVQPLEHATIETIRRALKDFDPHVLHFMGHGDFDPFTGEGFLLLEDGSGGREPLSGDPLSVLLKDSNVRLAVLNACRTGQTPSSPDLPPYATLGPALSLAGIPAVVAMQFRIPDDAAIFFNQVFYAALASGDHVDVAVGEARQALYARTYASRSLVWAAPVLFLRAEDGRIFALPRHEPTPAPLSLPRVETMTPPTTEPEPLLLGLRSLEPLGDRPKKTLLLTRYFQGRDIRDQALWYSEVLPRLKKFLGKARKTRQPLILDFAAHASLAFASGYILEAKDSLDVTIRQRSLSSGHRDWHPEDGPLPEPPFWLSEEDLLRDETSNDVAVAVSITWPVVKHVEVYLNRERIPVRRILRATLAPEPGSRGVRNGAHALALAQSLALRIRARTIAEQYGTLHLFISAPNAVPFYLGQLARGLGRIQLYEHNHESGIPGDYTPSILLPWDR